jgi:hypothetical protein
MAGFTGERGLVFLLFDSANLAPDRFSHLLSTSKGTTAITILRFPNALGHR